MKWMPSIGWQIGGCLFVACLGLAGCQKTPVAETSTEASGRDGITATEVLPSVDRRQAIAVKAKDALFTALSGRLMQVLQEKGPSAAIEVCSQEATQIAETIGREQGVEIGRTSFKLRNPNNAPRDWVQPVVQQRVDKPQSLVLENGNWGATFPIHLDVKCLMCHGGPDDILEEVKVELANRYPADQATGFKQGDLRGWFWVEVPPERPDAS